jgi:hypothetical protein
MFDGIWNTIKGLFVKPDGGINWRTIIGIGAGVALGASGLASGFLGADTMTAAFLGGGIGLVGSALVGLVMPSEAPVAGATPAPVGAVTPPAPGMQITPPLPTPGTLQTGAGRGPGG